MSKKQTALDDRLIGVEELSRITGLAKTTWYERISEQRVPFSVYRPFGRAVRFKMSEVWNWIEGQRSKV